MELNFVSNFSYLNAYLNNIFIRKMKDKLGGYFVNQYIYTHIYIYIYN